MVICFRNNFLLQLIQKVHIIQKKTSKTKKIDCFVLHFAWGKHQILTIMINLVFEDL